MLDELSLYFDNSDILICLIELFLHREVALAHTQACLSYIYG